MNQFKPWHRMWRHWAMGLAVFVATAGAPSRGQTPTGAAARPPANPNAPLMVLSPKAKSAGWTEVYKPHTKLADVLARHKDQAEWAETIVDDESLFAQWISMGPGKKTPFAQALVSTPAGNGGRILLPWFSPEITPPVSAPGVHRYGPAAGGPSDVRAVVEGQMLSMALHSRRMVSKVETIHAAGGATINREIVQVMADVFGTRVFQMPAGNSAALGAALRAAHAHMLARNGSTSWADVIAGLAEPLANSRVDPDPDRHSLYRDMCLSMRLVSRMRSTAVLIRAGGSSAFDTGHINGARGARARDPLTAARVQRPWRNEEPPL